MVPHSGQGTSGCPLICVARGTVISSPQIGQICFLATLLVSPPVTCSRSSGDIFCISEICFSFLSIVILLHFTENQAAHPPSAITIFIWSESPDSSLLSHTFFLNQVLIRTGTISLYPSVPIQNRICISCCSSLLFSTKHNKIIHCFFIFDRRHQSATSIRGFVFSKRILFGILPGFVFRQRTLFCECPGFVFGLIILF